MSTLTDTLDLLTAALGPSLISPRHLARIRDLGASLPGSLASGVMFECHLADPTPRTDLEVRVKGSEVGRGILAGLGASPWSSALLDHPIWVRVRELAREWADPTSVLHRRIDNVWLEFDIEPDEGRIPLPSCFFAPLNGIQSGETYGWVTDSALRLVTGRPVPATTERMLFRSFDALPTGANVFQLGVMLPRGSEAVRCCIVGLPTGAIADYLHDLRWPGSLSELRALISRLAGHADRIALDVDVADRIMGRIGLECYLADFRQPGDEPRWAAFLEQLVDLGLCRADRREAVLAYPGLVTETVTPDPWPAHLRTASALVGSRASSSFARVLHHVKLVYEPGRPLVAKAYLGAFHHWLGS